MVVSKTRQKFIEILFHINLENLLFFVEKWRKVSKFVEIHSHFVCTELYLSTGHL